MQGLIDHMELYRRPRCPPSRRGALTLEKLRRILRRLAPLVFSGAGGSVNVVRLDSASPNFEELVIDAVLAAGVRLDSGLGPIDDPSLREHLGRGNMALRERRPACRIVPPAVMPLPWLCS